MIDSDMVVLLKRAWPGVPIVTFNLSQYPMTEFATVSINTIESRLLHLPPPHGFLTNRVIAVIAEELYLRPVKVVKNF